jgi:SAM-dependent methyltransferase
LRLRDLGELWRLSVRRAESEQSYREFQGFQARLLIRYMEDHGVRFAGSSLLDLGSGLGGYSRELAARGARVIAADLTQPRTRDAAIRYIRASGDAVPVRDAAVDLVFCASLIEHVPEPERVLAEIERVLKPGGAAYVSFPPYWSPLGGHEYAPYHYLGERMAMRLRRRRRVPAWVEDIYPVRGEAESFSDLFEGWGLFRMTVRKFRRLLRQTRFRCLDMSTRYLPASFIRWPWIGEVLTWHAQFLLRKPPGAP